MARDPFSRGFFRKLLYIQVGFGEIPVHFESNREPTPTTQYHDRDWRLPIPIDHAPSRCHVDRCHLHVCVCVCFLDFFFGGGHWIIEVKHPLETRCCSNYVHLYLAGTVTREWFWTGKVLMLYEYRCSRHAAPQFSTGKRFTHYKNDIKPSYVVMWEEDEKYYLPSGWRWNQVQLSPLVKLNSKALQGHMEVLETQI